MIWFDWAKRHLAKWKAQIAAELAAQRAEPIKFTPRAVQVMALARKEAERFNHDYIGTEHVLLGLLKLGHGVAVNVLHGLNVNLESVREAVEKEAGINSGKKAAGHIPYTPRVKKVLALATKEAKSLNHTYTGTEHLLLGLLAEADGVAGRILKSLKVDLEQARKEILKELDPHFSRDGMERGWDRIIDESIVASDRRYPKDAYFFVLQGLLEAKRKKFPRDNKEVRGVSGGQLLEVLRQLAIECYGKQAKATLNNWGIFKCEDFGEIVFNMVNAGLLAETGKDSKADFQNGYDFDSAFPSN